MSRLGTIAASPSRSPLVSGATKAGSGPSSPAALKSAVCRPNLAADTVSVMERMRCVPEGWGPFDPHAFCGQFAGLMVVLAPSLDSAASSAAAAWVRV